MFGVNRRLPLLKAMNLVTSKPASDIALAAPTASGQMLDSRPLARARPRRHRSLRDVRRARRTRGDRCGVGAFIADANHAFPALSLTRADVTLVHRGIVPAIEGKDGKPDLRPEPEIRDHAQDGVAGAITVIGVKYTTARGVAERAVNLAGRFSGSGSPAPGRRRRCCPARGSRITKRWPSKLRVPPASSFPPR